MAMDAIRLPYSLPQNIAIMNEATMLIIPTTRNAVANAHGLCLNSEEGVDCGMAEAFWGTATSVSGLKDIVFSSVAGPLPRLRTMFTIIKATIANKTIKITNSVISQIVYAITKIVPIKHIANIAAAHFTWTGIGLFVLETGSVALSYKSHSALKNKKFPKLKFIYF